MEKRHDNRVNHSPQRQEEPDSPTLIPEHVVDQASQRLFVLSIFAAIQCWKIYDILLVKADAFTIANAVSNPGASMTGTGVGQATLTSLNNFSFVLKYALMDGVFLWLLPVLNIPLLSFSPLLTLLLTVAINSANFVLTSNSALPLLSSTFVPLWNVFHKHKELTILGDSVSPKSSVDMNSHFRGRYTIQYLPESSVTLNPFRFGNMCLESPDSGSSSFPYSIRLPIEFNTTNDVGFISIERLTPDNTVDYLNYSRSDIRKLARKDYSGYANLPGYVSNDERVFYLDAEIKQPGKYKISRVLDVDGMVIRSYKSEFTIGYCPSVKFVYPGAEAAYTGHKCFTKDVSDLSWTVPMVSAFGMLPLSVEFATYHNGKKINTFKKTIADPQLDNLIGIAWLQCHSLTRNSVEQELLRAPQDFNSVGSGSLEFQILSVSDPHGNQRRYNDKSKDKDVNFLIELKKAPALSLRDKYPGRKLVFNSSKMLFIESSGEISFPLKVVLAHETEDQSADVKSLDFTFHSMEELAKGLKITHPGIYHLVSASDKDCPCETDVSPIDIVRPSLPSVKITDTPISDKCVGTIGYEFDLKFQGTPPFEISYEVLKNSSGVIKPVLSDRGLKQHKQKSLKADYNFQFKPNKEGNYILVFKNIKDLYYNHDPVPVPEAASTFFTHIKKRSQFRLFHDTPTKVKEISLCKDQSTQIPVHFEGHFPFSFVHDIVDLKTGNLLRSEKHELQFDNEYIIDVPKFVEGGEYGVRVRDVKDNLGCPAESSFEQEIRIRAREDTPSIEISDSASSLIVQGDSAKIPLDIKSSLGGSSDDEIVYSWTSLHDKAVTKTFTLHGRSGLMVREEGVYKLVSFLNGGCSGVVKDQAKTFTLRHHAKPNLTITPELEQLLNTEASGNFSLKPLCQDENQKLKIRLEGKKPFIVSYEIKFPSGRSKSSSLEIDNNEVLLPLPSSREGFYHIVFSGVSDALYSKERLRQLSYKHHASIITYEVKAHPLLRVKQPFVQLCETKVKNDFDLQIPLVLEGAPPFKIEGRILSLKQNESRKFFIDSLRDPIIRFSDLNLSETFIEQLSVGKHEILFESISDASHCKTLKLLEDNKVVVSITPVPAISKHRKSGYYCVGDRIAYNMSGVSPFVVYYRFNDQNRKAESKHDFVRLASKPGELAIVALQDSSAGQCLVNYTKHTDTFEELKLQVHDLPSVEISHGDSIIKNLHEGDQSEITFKFIGTPPFSVTYVRTLGEEDDQHKRKKGTRSQRGSRRVVETKTVKDIWDYEYSEVVSLQGTYDAIEVTDAFCAASRDIQEIL